MRAPPLQAARQFVKAAIAASMPPGDYKGLDAGGHQCRGSRAGAAVPDMPLPANNTFWSPDGQKNCLTGCIGVYGQEDASD